jgi:hypothetical protein
MSICSEWIHCFHHEFDAQPKIEKMKWYAFARARGEEDERKDNERKFKQNASAAVKSSRGRKK